MIPALIYYNRISRQKSNFLKKLQSTNSGDSWGKIFINFWWSTKLLLGIYTIWLSKQQNSIKAITTENGEDELIFKPAKLYSGMNCSCQNCVITRQIRSSHHSSLSGTNWKTNGVVWGSSGASEQNLQGSSSYLVYNHYTTEKRWDTKFSRKDLDLDDETFSKNSTWVTAKGR